MKRLAFHRSVAARLSPMLFPLLIAAGCGGSDDGGSKKPPVTPPIPIDTVDTADTTKQDTDTVVPQKEDTVSAVSVTAQTFPTLDGSDSTTPLRTILMCKLMGYGYNWERRPFTQNHDEDIKVVYPEWGSEDDRTVLRKKMQTNNTHASFVNLIDGSVDLILTARSISRDERKYADEQGVELKEKPIARDALTFMVNPQNPVASLTIQQIQKIYTGEITNWQQLGGNDAKISPYVRNANSGSQEKFETMVMAGLTMPEYPTMLVGLVMMSPYFQLKSDAAGIGFTPYYYYAVIVDNGTTRALAVNGIAPSKATIRDGSYPLCTEVYAAVRADVDTASTAYQIFRFLTSSAGQSIVKESGYVPLRD